MLFSVVLVVLVSQTLAGFYNRDNWSMAMEYLNKYHYLSTTRAGNQNVNNAIKNFQSFAGLPVTGELDEATVNQMKKPRCGMPDVNVGGRVRRYNLVGSQWNKKRLTYYIGRYTADLPKSTQRRVFKKALKFWSDVSGLSFSQTSSQSSADLKINFAKRRRHMGKGETWCNDWFDGPGGTIAHAYFPSDGRAHFDDQETFSDGSDKGTDLLWVATHEFGHSLGIHHSSTLGAIMYPYYDGYVPNMKLHKDDIDAIQSLYGKN